MGVTSHDVARLAGVSQPTVSRALRGDVRVAAATQERVRRAAAELGYVASELGRSLATSTTRQIAMVADLENPLYPTLVGPLHDRFAEHELRMVLLAERGDDRATYERVLDRSVDGVVLTTTLLGSSLSAGLLSRGLPFVELNRLSELSGVDGVTADNVEGGALCARLLLEAGHKRIAAVLGTGETSTARDRETGFRAALAEAGVELPESRVARGGFTWDDGERGFDRLMVGRHRPTALFCVSDTVAVGAVNEATRRGLTVPGDVAVVGFDDHVIAAWPQFQLTTVRVDLAGMAFAAADRLVARLGGDRSPPRTTVFGVEPVLRRSHGS
jgi:LacI family transcriptional regulator